VLRRGVELELVVWEQVVGVDLNCPMRVCADGRPFLKSRGGCIVNTASLSFVGASQVPD
jgi:hypothetical protein